MSIVNDLAAEYWECVLEHAPSYATFVGDHRFTDRIEDASAEAEAELRSVLSDLHSRVGDVDPAGLSLPDRVTRGLLLNETHNSIAGIDERFAELACDQMQGAHAGLLQIAPQTIVPNPENAARLVERYGKIGGLLDQTADRFRAGVASGRPPARINVERSLNQIDQYLASPVEADPFTNTPPPAGPDGWDGLDAWRDDLAGVVRDVIRPGYERYRSVFADELMPAARDSDQPGLCWIDGGDELYATMAHIHTSTELAPDEIHDIGLTEIHERLPREYAEIGTRLFGTGDLDEIFATLRDDPGLRFNTADEIMERARASLAKATAAMGDWFGRLPEIECLIEEVPEYLAQDAPAAYYFPPAGDRSRPGTYFVNCANPGDKARFEAESIGYHEAIPGHHLQLAISAELPDVPDFQRFSMGNTAYVEGWGLYSERLADEMGLYGTDLDRIGMLTADSWRAGRLVVDTGIHAKGWTRRQAIDFLAENTPLDRDEITVEIDRYIGMPGQALAYKIGQREIFRLRAHARAELGQRFDIKGFHDTVLGSGSVTLGILADLVDNWISERV